MYVLALASLYDACVRYVIGAKTSGGQFPVLVARSRRPYCWSLGGDWLTFYIPVAKQTINIYNT